MTTTNAVPARASTMDYQADRDLLKLAAKAAGIPISTWSNCQAGGFIAREAAPTHRTNFWNPLTDDGDAFRLAVTLHISIAFWKEDVSALVGMINREFPEAYVACPYTSTRRAIVRAAAEIGRQAAAIPTEGS